MTNSLVVWPVDVNSELHMLLQEVSYLKVGTFTILLCRLESDCDLHDHTLSMVTDSSTTGVRGLS